MAPSFLTGAIFLFNDCAAALPRRAQFKSSDADR